MERLSREECVRRMRERLLELSGGEEELTVCDAAAEGRVFCRGFDRFPDHVLRERFPWLSQDGPDREELLRRIREWIHAREFVLGLPTACDVMALEGDLCFGWDTFDDEKLAASYQELFGEEVEIVG